MNGDLTAKLLSRNEHGVWGRRWMGRKEQKACLRANCSVAALPGILTAFRFSFILRSFYSHSPPHHLFVVLFCFVYFEITGCLGVGRKPIGSSRDWLVSRPGSHPLDPHHWLGNSSCQDYSGDRVNRDLGIALQMTHTCGVIGILFGHN